MEVKIGGYLIKVEVSETILANESRIGEYSPFEQKITLQSGLTKQQKDETLIHEIIEAINDIYELNLEHDEQICKLSVVLHQVVTDNPELINALFVCD